MTKELRAALDRVCREWAVDSPENQAVHGWRCKHPDRYPEPCGHYEAFLDELVAAAHLSPTPEEQP